MPIFWSDLPADDHPTATVVPAAPAATVTQPSRWADILVELTTGPGVTPLVQRTCEVGIDLLEVTGAGLSLIGGAHHQLLLHTTDALARDLGEAQVGLGQGPCLEAVRTGNPVLVDDLGRDRHPTWTAYADHARRRGVQALFSFPIRTGGVQVGSLDLYRCRSGPLSGAQLSDAATLVEITGRAIAGQQPRPRLAVSVHRRPRPGLQGQRTAPGQAQTIDFDVTLDDTLDDTRLRAPGRGRRGAGARPAGADRRPLGVVQGDQIRTS